MSTQFSAKKNFHNPFVSESAQKNNKNVQTPQKNNDENVSVKPIRDYRSPTPLKESTRHQTFSGNKYNHNAESESYKNKQISPNNNQASHDDEYMPEQEQQFSASVKPTAQFKNAVPAHQRGQSGDFILQDLSANDQSLNDSVAKPMLQNPLGINQSYMANISNPELSKSKIDTSINKTRFVELGQKQREDEKEYYELNPNQSYQNGDLRVRPINLSRGALSDVTDDTKDLSQMNLHNLKGNVYSQNNSYYLNASTLQDPNRSRRLESIANKVAATEQPQEFVKADHQKKNSIHIVDDFVTPDRPEFQKTGNFGPNSQVQQPTDLLSYVNSGADLAHSKALLRPTEKSHIPNNKNKKGFTKEIEVILEGLEVLELSKISNLSENFLEDEEDGHANPRHVKNKASLGKLPPTETKAPEENITQKILAQIKKNLEPKTIASQYSSNQYNSNYQTNCTKSAEPMEDFTLNKTNVLSPTNNNISNYQSNFSSVPKTNQPFKTTPSMTDLSRTGTFGEDLSKKLTQIQDTNNQKNEQNSTSTYRNLSIPGSHRVDQVTPSHKVAPIGAESNVESYRSSLKKIDVSDYKSLDRNTRGSNTFKTPRAVMAESRFIGSQIQEASQVMERVENLYSEYQAKNAGLIQSASSSVRNSQVYGLSNMTGQKNSIDNGSGARFSDEFTHKIWRQTTHGFLEKKARASNVMHTPYDLRYSVRDPNHFDSLPTEAATMKTRQNYQEFIKQDLLADIDSPDVSKVLLKKGQELKTFSNPVFKKVELRDTTPNQQRKSDRNYQQESMNLINKIFDTPNVNQDTSIATPSILRTNKEPLGTKSQNVNNKSSVVVPASNKGSILDPTNKGSFAVVKLNYKSSVLSNQLEEEPRFKNKQSERPKVNHRTRRNLSSVFDDEANICVDDEETNIQLPVIHYNGTKDLFSHKLFGFQVKKEKFIEGKDERKIKIDNIEIICLNCQEFIKMSKVDKHSETCDKSSQQVEDDGNKSIGHNLSGINVKLFGIKDRIKQKISSLSSKGPSVTETLNQIIKIVDRIIDENESIENLENHIQQVETTLEEISKSNLLDQDLGLLIYINRILVLAQEKYNELVESEEDLEVLENKIREFERETVKQKAELEVWQHQAHVMTQIKQNDDRNLRYAKKQYKKDNEVISQIHSDIEIEDKESSHGGTTVTSGSGVSSQINLVAFKTAKENAKSENNKVKFYSLAVNLKLTLPSSHKGKDMLISDLYDDCLAEKVTEAGWDNFIRNKLMC